MNVNVPVCVFIPGFLPCGAAEFIADYSGDAPLCCSVEAGASPLMVLTPSVPPSFLATGSGCNVPTSPAKETEAWQRDVREGAGV